MAAVATVNVDKLKSEVAALSQIRCASLVSRWIQL